MYNYTPLNYQLSYRINTILQFQFCVKRENGYEGMEYGESFWRKEQNPQKLYLLFSGKENCLIVLKAIRIYH